MKDYIERMIKEAIELDSRIEKLRKYQDTYDVGVGFNFNDSPDLSHEEYILMGEQRTSMEDYIETLERRIGLAMIKEAKEQNNEASKA